MMKKKQLPGHILKPAGLIDQMAVRVETVKSRSSIVSVFAHYGVKLKASGTSGEYTGLCCFHDDKNPSLSVNEDKKVFTCHGCGKSGNIFALVQEKEGLDFGEALGWLERFNGAKHLFTEKKEVNDKPLKVEPTAISLKHIVEHYQKHLNDKALAYLKTRGLDNPELLNRFKIGFSDGSLIEKLSDGQQESLARVGILKQTKDDQYFESFSGHVVFPITDSNDQVVELYGRSISAKSSYPHLYQSGGHKGIFNCKAVKVYDQIILTESIIDVLSLIQLGFNNTTACFGTNGFTEHHLKAFKEGNVKAIIIAFDNDEAGQKAADKLKDQLLAEGFEVKIIAPPILKDWNEELLNSIAKEDIDQLINDAEIFKKAEDKRDFIHSKENKLDIFIINDITYKIGGAKDTFVNNLKVSITAEKGEDFFPDTLDLCSHRSRLGFCAHLADRFNIEPKRIENDLLRILKYLQDQMMRRLSPDDEAEDELTEEEKEAGMALLKSSDLSGQIISDMTTLGYVGEDLNKLLIYLCATSRLTDNPLSILIISQSAAGKSYLVDTVKKLLPPKEMITIHSTSDQGLNYVKDLMNKFLAFGEAIFNPQVEQQIREMLSSKELSRLVAEKDSKTGEIIGKIIGKEVNVACVMSTTSNKVHPENASRFFVINADESVEQTKRIHQLQKIKYSEENYLARKNIIPQIKFKHISAQKLLRKIQIVIPQGLRENLNFPSTTMRTRRDNDRFIDLIAVVCFLRQYQKEVQSFSDGEEYICCDLADYEIAYQIIKTILPATLFDLPSPAIELYNEFRKQAKKAAETEGIKPVEVQISQRVLRESTDFNHVFIKRYLKYLVDFEYLKSTTSHAKGSKYKYSLVEDEPIENIDMSAIPTPEEMGKKLQKVEQ